MIDFATHPWMRGLLGEGDIAAVFAPEAELRRMLEVEAAWTRALGVVNNAPEVAEIAARIETAQISPSDLQDGFALDGVPIPALVEILKAQSPPDSAQWIHKGLTSQDVMDTSLVLALQEVLSILKAHLDALDLEFETLQARFGSSPIMTYTRMQPALETSVSEIIERWQQPLSRLGTRLTQIKDEAAQIQWGGPIGVRDHPLATKLGSAFAEALGLTEPGASWHTDRGIIADIAHILVQITVRTGKIGEDIALMAAIGPAQITLAGGGSSAMAHKNNPVKAETLVALSDFAGTLQLGLTRSSRHEAQRSGRAWILEWMMLPQLCIVAGASLLQASQLSEAIQSMGAKQ